MLGAPCPLNCLPDVDLLRTDWTLVKPNESGFWFKRSWWIYLPWLFVQLLSCAAKFVESSRNKKQGDEMPCFRASHFFISGRTPHHHQWVQGPLRSSARWTLYQAYCYMREILLHFTNVTSFCRQMRLCWCHKLPFGGGWKSQDGSSNRLGMLDTLEFLRRYFSLSIASCRFTVLYYESERMRNEL